MQLHRLLIYQLSFLQLAAAVVLLSEQIIRLTTPYLPFRASIHFMVRLVIGCCWTCSWMIWREKLDSALGDRLQPLHKWIFRSWACWGQALCCFWNRKSMAILLERPLNGCQAEWCCWVIQQTITQPLFTHQTPGPMWAALSPNLYSWK